ncbi:GTPase ObgE [Candidatus Sumerlaeota bacterium]|nr:GTPase ObgE [Candidatus Sumerlaeota bacterium]
MSAFVDYVKVFCHAGRGGNGCMSFRREKFVPFGGPDGGDGGNGGNIYLEADPGMMTLLDCKMQPHYKSAKGGEGRGKNQHGRNGPDVVLKVPQGTIITALDENGEEVDVVDLAEPAQRMLAARGGKGGRGNSAFATASNRAPRIREEGTLGEERTLILELKLIADVGLVGLPNAGKSTLLANLTRATPKIADYPFTTLHPNLGVIELEFGEKITLADIPGLIEGASKGQGLGHRFLRHIERTRMLVHLVAIEPDKLDFERMWATYEIVRHELQSYTERLTALPEVVALNKTDLVDAEFEPLLEEVCEEFQARGVRTLLLSAIDDEKILHLKQEITRLYEQLQRIEE